MGKTTWEERVKIEEDKVRKHFVLEGPNRTNCWWLKGKKKKKKKKGS